MEVQTRLCLARATSKGPELVNVRIYFGRSHFPICIPKPARAQLSTTPSLILCQYVEINYFRKEIGRTGKN